MALIYATVAAICPYIGFSIIISLLGEIPENYDYITVKMRIRYGNDGVMYYYERQTRFYGDGVLVNTFEDMGSEPL